MLISVEEIEAFVDDIRMRGQSPEELQIKMNVANDAKKSIRLHIKGNVGIEMPSNYYDNLKENLIALQHTVLIPLHNNIKCVMDFNITIDENGNFELNKIPVHFNILLPENIRNPDSFFHEIMKNYCLMYKYIHHMSFKGMVNAVRQINMYAEINAMEINELFLNGKINFKILQNWLTVINKCMRDIQSQDKKHTYSNDIGVVNGKLFYTYRQTTISKKIKI